MSNYTKLTQHPRTGETLEASWLDDYFGRHRYGVRFPNGDVFREEEVEAAKQVLTPLRKVPPRPASRRD